MVNLVPLTHLSCLSTLKTEVAGPLSDTLNQTCNLSFISLQQSAVALQKHHWPENLKYNEKWNLPLYGM